MPCHAIPFRVRNTIPFHSIRKVYTDTTTRTYVRTLGRHGKCLSQRWRAYLPLRKTERPTKLTSAALRNIDEAMEEDDETTAKELVTALRGAGVSVSTYTALKGRRLLGWTSRGTAYCQLLYKSNTQKVLLSQKWSKAPLQTPP